MLHFDRIFFKYLLINSLLVGSNYYVLICNGLPLFVFNENFVFFVNH